MSQQKIYLVRHAEASMNGRYCGSIDASLSARGRVQAKACAKFFRKINLDVCFVSDLKRTLQTSSYLLKNRKTPLLKCPDLREIKFGEWEGKDYKTVSEKFPRAYNLWMKNPSQICFPKGETFSCFYKRIKIFSRFLLQNRSPQVLVVAHGGTLAVLKLILLKKPKSHFWKLVPKLASISVLKRKINSSRSLSNECFRAEMQGF